jgi:tripartite-type tricarboxylate transporter receptor subunit TctC
MVKLFALCLTLMFVLVIAGCGGAQEAQKPAEVTFPTKGVTVICPWAAGGGTDALARALGKSMETTLKQTVTVNNITGGGGATGHGAGLNAPKDGYSVTMITFELVSLPPQKLIPFTYKDYDLLARINVDPAALTVPKDAPYNTLQEFIDYAKQNPGKINVGNSGPGSVWHIAGALFGKAAGIELNHVPFNGAAPAITDLVGGHIQAVSVSAAEVRGQVEAGKLKILGVMDDNRLTYFPDVPTFKEQKVDVVFGTWRGYAVPKGTPEPVKEILVTSIQKGLETPEFLEFAKNSGFGIAFLPPAEFGKYLDANSAMVEATMKDIGLAK